MLLQVKDLIHIIVKFTTKKNCVFLSSPPVILLRGAPLNIAIGHEVLCSNKGTDVISLKENKLVCFANT